MIINISELLNQYSESKEIKCLSEIKSFTYDNQEIYFTKPPELSGTIKNGGKVFAFEGNIKSSFNIDCDRCLEKFEYNLDFDFSEKFSLFDSDDDINIIVGNSINIDQIIIDNILLNLPIRFLCNDLCKGLCPICGTNNNLDKCNCNQDTIDPRLAVLKKLFK